MLGDVVRARPPPQAPAWRLSRARPHNRVYCLDLFSSQNHKVFLAWADGGIFSLPLPRAAGCTELGLPGADGSGCVVPH